MHSLSVYRYYGRELRMACITLFAITFIFLFFFKPFEVNPQEIKFHYAFICFIHAICPTLIAYTYFNIVNRLQPARVKEKITTLKKEMVDLLAIALLIGICSFFVRDIIYTNPDNWSWYYLGQEIKNAFLASIFLGTYLHLINFYQQQQKLVPAITGLQDPKGELPHEIRIITQVRNDDFLLNPASLLFARAEGNYIHFYISTAAGVGKELKRISLKQLEEQLTHFPFLFRSHRTYLLNLQQIKSYSGNSSGYLVSFQQSAEKVPVARNRLAAFETLLTQLPGSQSL